MKLRVFLLMVASLFVFAACSGSDETATEQEQDGTEAKETEEGGIEVDKGLLNVEITLPGEMLFGDETVEELMEEAAEETGVKEVTQNDDGSVTFKMSKQEHKQMLKEMAEQMEETVNDIKTDEDFVSIQDITFDKSFSEFTMVVDREAFANSFDGFAALGLGLSGMVYQLFSGEDIDTSEVIIYVEDEATGEVFEEVVYPEALEDLEDLEE